MVLKNHDFSFATSPDDVGMKTGATIHTMNGLNMVVKKVSKEDPIPQTDGWWQKQHLKRGLTASGKPYQTNAELAFQNIPKPDPRRVDPGTGCPMHDPNL